MELQRITGRLKAHHRWVLAGLSFEMTGLTVTVRSGGRRIKINVQRRDFCVEGPAPLVLTETDPLAGLGDGPAGPNRAQGDAATDGQHVLLLGQGDYARRVMPADLLSPTERRAPGRCR